MPTKGSGEGDLREIDRFDGGVGWFAHPEESMRRASHALDTDAGVWVVDPVDAPGVDDFLADLGEVAGVLVLLDRHRRDAAAVARRHDVAVHVPDWFSGVAEALDAPVRRLGDGVPGTDYRVRRVLDWPVWNEAALHHPDDGTLVVPEALGTAPFFRIDDERVGVHPVLRAIPPRSLGKYDAERLLVGHGEGVMADADAAVADALDGSRRRMFGLYAKNLRAFLR